MVDVTAHIGDRCLIVGFRLSCLRPVRDSGYVVSRESGT